MTHLGEVLPAILDGLSDESEGVRDAALAAARAFVEIYAKRWALERVKGCAHLRPLRHQQTLCGILWQPRSASASSCWLQLFLPFSGGRGRRCTGQPGRRVKGARAS
jgi:hypothetical protein